MHTFSLLLSTLSEHFVCTTISEFWSLIFHAFFPTAFFSFLKSFFFVEVLVFFFPRANITILLFFFICCIFCVSELTCAVKQVDFLAVSSKRWDILLVFDVFSPPPPPPLFLSLSPFTFQFLHWFSYCLSFSVWTVSCLDASFVFSFLKCWSFSFSKQKKKQKQKTVWHAVKIVKPFTVTGRTHAS